MDLLLDADAESPDVLAPKIEALFAVEPTDEMVGEICAVIENRCGTVRGIGPAVREALAKALGTARSCDAEPGAWCDGPMPGCPSCREQKP